MENIDCSDGSFLDLEKNIVHKKINIRLYDKRDNLPFSIVKMPHLTNTIPWKCFILHFEQRCFEQLLLPVTVKHFKGHLRIWYPECPNCMVISMFLQKHWGKYMAGILKHSESFIILQKSMLIFWLNNVDRFLD